MNRTTHIQLSKKIPSLSKHLPPLLLNTAIFFSMKRFWVPFWLLLVSQALLLRASNVPAQRQASPFELETPSSIAVEEADDQNALNGLGLLKSLPLDDGDPGTQAPSSSPILVESLRSKQQFLLDLYQPLRLSIEARSAQIYWQRTIPPFFILLGSFKADC